jgi:hypothetical protein
MHTPSGEQVRPSAQVSGSAAFVTLVQTPSGPVQAWQAGQVGVWQQIASTQEPVVHCSGWAQREPGASFGKQRPPAQ